MQFTIKNIKESINGLMRKIGYQPAYFQEKDQFSIIRKLTGNDYPRFHLYIKEEDLVSNSIELDTKLTGKNYIFNLHLDQKKPSYEGAKGHSGEHDGEVVKGEANRIIEILNPKS